MGKKNLLQFSATACSPVSVRSLICDIHLVLTIQGDCPLFCPSSPAMIHQGKQETLGTENLDVQLWLLPHLAGLKWKGMRNPGKKPRADGFRGKFYISDLELRITGERKKFTT